jgi:PAS domain S-box-containing protein
VTAEPLPAHHPLAPDLASILDAALDCVVAMDAEGRIVVFNAAAERTFGIAAAEAVGRDTADLIVPGHLRARHRQGLARHLAGGPAVVLDRRIEIEAMRADGSTFPTELTVTRVRWTTPALFVGWLRDITDRKQAEAELKASRMRIVEAADASRRRIERDLHDGAQQRLILTGMQLRALQRRAREADPELAAGLDDALAELDGATNDLRELARGIHPAVLTEGGLRPALRALAGRSAVPVRLAEVAAERFAPSVEATAYFFVAEALANVARHAAASAATVSAVFEERMALVVTVADDGRGGASADGGSGLRGLGDRVAALGGALAVDSPPGAGTTIRAVIPCAS